jgi:hypothetical protein
MKEGSQIEYDDGLIRWSCALNMEIPPTSPRVYRRFLKEDIPAYWLTDQTTGKILDPFQPDYWLNTADIKQVWKLSGCNHFIAAALKRKAAQPGGRGFVVANTPLRYNSDGETISDASTLSRRQRSYRDSAADGIVEWLAANRNRSNVNWVCNMVVSLRLASWCWALWMDHTVGKLATERIYMTAIEALVDHVNHIIRHFECDGLHTNHYVANLAAVHVAAQLFPALSGMDRIERDVRHRLEDEIRRQVEETGVDYEFSLHYHRLVTELFAYPLFLNEAMGRHDFSAQYRERVDKMIRVLEAAVNRAGTLPQIGDNDSEIMWCIALDAVPPRNIGPFLLASRRLLASPASSVQEALMIMTGMCNVTAEADWAQGRENGEWIIYTSPGWAFRRFGPFDLAFICGGIGTKGYGVHDHVHPNEVLVSAQGVEFIVDGGTGFYTRDMALRNRLRSAVGHSTADLGFDSAIPDGQLSGLWRMKQTWKARLESRGDVLAGTCRCGCGRHDREVAPAGDRLRVLDRVSGAPAAALRWMFHPDVRVVALGGGAWSLKRDGVCLRLSVAGAESRLDEAVYSDFFSQIGRTRCLVIPAGPGTITTELESV